MYTYIWLIYQGFSNDIPFALNDKPNLSILIYKINNFPKNRYSTFELLLLSKIKIRRYFLAHQNKIISKFHMCPIYFAKNFFLFFAIPIDYNMWDAISRINVHFKKKDCITNRVVFQMIETFANFLWTWKHFEMQLTMRAIKPNIVYLLKYIEKSCLF